MIGDIRWDSGEGYNDLDEEIILISKDEKFFVLNKEGGSLILEVVIDREIDGLVIIIIIVDGVVYEFVVDSFFINLFIVDDVELDIGDDLCDVVVDNEGWVYLW